MPEVDSSYTFYESNTDYVLTSYFLFVCHKQILIIAATANITWLRLLAN